MASLSLPHDISDVITDHCNVEAMKTIKTWQNENSTFYFELDNVMRIWNILLQLQREKHPRINYCNMVQCAIHNRLYEDFRITPIDISYFELEPHPPSWLLALAARNRAKRVVTL